MDWMSGIVVALIAWFVLSNLSTKKGSKTGPAPLKGNGRFSVDVVGESFYDDNLKRLLGSTAGTEDDIEATAVLDLQTRNEHDAQAVAVTINGLQVGNLSRKMARDLRTALKRDKLGTDRNYTVKCRIYGGGRARLFSVSLDLPEE